MGTPKACLEWHGSTLLYRTAALLRRTVTGPVVVVLGADDEAGPLRTPDGSSHPVCGVRTAAKGCEVGSGAPLALPAGVIVAHDPMPGLGPLQGIAAGLAAVQAALEAGAGTADGAAAGAVGADGTGAAAFVCATDMPFLHPAFVRAVLGALDGDVALPVARGHRQPLAAAYRVGLAHSVAALLAEGGRTPGQLFARSRVTVLDDAALRADPAVARLDPELASLTNVNTPAEYAAARAQPPAPVAVERAGIRRTVRAATLAEAGLGSAVLLNGAEVAPDPGLPLVAGDTLVLR
jgi:molybdopterin-guanine dinucleotide biosynthesis protein A